MKKRLVVMIPAFNEEQSIVEVIRRIPRHVLPDVLVEVIVIDDGSTDQTARLAAMSDATVIAHPVNRGLGAAVRTGLAYGHATGADGLVMIDADLEYPPERIPALAERILYGHADYVLGSRFMGQKHNMKWNRRAGNTIFTWLQSVILGRKITDGQTGMRAFSPRAMQIARIIHDYNYAQVLTLSLVRQGCRMEEMPIEYRIRTTGTSFIRFFPYLYHVFRGIFLELVSPVEGDGQVKTLEQ